MNMEIKARDLLAAGWHEGRRMGPAMGDHALDERPDAPQSRVRLLGSEVTHGHNPMIRIR